MGEKIFKHIFIINPAAGKKDNTSLVTNIINTAAKNNKIDYDIRITEYPKHASIIVQSYIEKYSDQKLRFYACGGDGTLNEVAASVVKSDNASFTHYPIGSGNDFIKLFGEDNLSNFRDMEKLINGDEIDLDYIESSCGISLNILSVGLDARIARDMAKYRRIPHIGGYASYIFSTIENVIKGMQNPYRIEINNKTYANNYTLILIANGCFYGGSFKAMPDADPTDGKLDILLIKGLQRLVAAGVIGTYKKGKYKELPEYIDYIQTDNLFISSGNSQKITINLDGEICQADSISINISKNKTHFVAPHGVNLVKPGTY
jgi:YegS/Rv2252/BmrU family lipid kinase